MDFHESCRLGRIEKTLEETLARIARLEKLVKKLLEIHPLLTPRSEDRGPGPYVPKKLRK